MGVKTIYLVQHIIGRYGRIIETDLKENLKRFDETLDTTIPIGKYFEQINDYIQNVDGGKQTRTPSHIINTDYNTVFSTGL